MTAHAPPIPPAQRPVKGTTSATDAKAAPAKTPHPAKGDENTDEQGDHANVTQNSTNRGRAQGH